MTIRGLVTGVVVVAAVGWGGKWALIDNSPTPEVSTFELDLDEVRRLSRSLAGPLPVRIESQVVTVMEFPSFSVVAGRGSEPHRLVNPAYQIVYPAGTIIIDTTMDRDALEASGRGVSFDEGAFKKVRSSLRRAGTILLTHGHEDHLGGLATDPKLVDLLPRVLITREQAENAVRYGFPEEAIAGLMPLEYDKYHAVAPGLVLIKAPGHSPGSQIVYVRLQNGAEYLFVGDIAWHMDNIEELTGRPLLVTALFMGEDRGAVAHQLRALHDLLETEDVLVVASHDEDQLQELIAAGRIAPTFR